MADMLMAEIVRHYLIPLREGAARAKSSRAPLEVRKLLLASELCLPLIQEMSNTVHEHLEQGVEAAKLVRVVTPAANALDGCLEVFGKIKEAAIAARSDTAMLAEGVATLNQTEALVLGIRQEMRTILEQLGQSDNDGAGILATITADPAGQRYDSAKDLLEKWRGDAR